MKLLSQALPMFRNCQIILLLNTETISILLKHILGRLYVACQLHTVDIDTVI